MMGFDPLVQFLHEADAIAAFTWPSDATPPARSTSSAKGCCRSRWRSSWQVGSPARPASVAELVAAARLGLAALGGAAVLLRYLRFLCVADGRKARDVLGFRPAHTSREAVLDFAGAQRLRDVKLLSERIA